MSSSASAGDKVQVGGKPYTLDSLKVERGDSLTKLVQKANPGIEGKELQELVRKASDLNGLNSESSIRAGQALLIPKAAEAAQAQKPSEQREQAAAFQGASSYTEAEPSQQSKPARSQGKPTSKDGFAKQVNNKRKKKPLEGAKAEATKGKGLSEADRTQIADKAQDILSAGHETGKQLASTLKGMKPAERDELMKNIAREEPEQLARLFGDKNVSAGDRKQISQALGGAYERGSLGSEDLGKLLDPKLHSHPNNPLDIAGAISQSGSEKLQKDAALQMLDAAGSTKQKGFDPKAYASAAAQAASGSAAAAGALLEKVGKDGLNDFISQIKPGSSPALTYNPALGNLLKAAADIQPPNQLSNDLFDKSCRIASDDRSIREGLSQFFVKNTDAITSRLASTSGDIEGKSAAMAAFTQNVIFGSDFEGQKEAREAYGQAIRQRVQDVQAGTADDPREQSRQLGFLVGGLEIGFKRAGNTDSARQGMGSVVLNAVADLAKNAIPFDVTLPGIGSVKGMTIGMLKDKIAGQSERAQNTLGRSLLEIARQIPGDFHESMESRRAAIKGDETEGYLN
jgi:hypothetical protein